jgi:hypothetical protein
VLHAWSRPWILIVSLIRGMPTAILKNVVVGPTPKQTPKLDSRLHPCLQLPSKSISVAVKSSPDQTTTFKQPKITTKTVATSNATNYQPLS